MIVFFHIINVTLWLTVLFPLTSSLGAVAKKTKLCGDEACSEKLFEGKFHRSSVANHESFLSPNENDVVNVYAIKFSDRTDLMEGALVREPTRRGNFFTMHINLDGYVEFLKNAVLNNKTMFMISMDPQDHPAHRLVGLKAALPELIKDYEVNAKRLAEEKQLPPPEQIDYAALGYIPDTRGHGHSHSHGSGHSHENLYTHSHSHDYRQPEQHIHQPAVPSTEAVPPSPVTNVQNNLQQEVPAMPVQHQVVQNNPSAEPVFGTERNIAQEIPFQQHVEQQSASSMTSNVRPTSNIVSDVPEQVVPPPISIPEQMPAASGNLPKRDVNDINFTGTVAHPSVLEAGNLATDVAHVNVDPQKVQAESLHFKLQLEEQMKRISFPPSPLPVANSSTLPPPVANPSIPPPPAANTPPPPVANTPPPPVANTPPPPVANTPPPPVANTPPPPIANSPPPPVANIPPSPVANTPSPTVNAPQVGSPPPPANVLQPGPPPHPANVPWTDPSPPTTSLPQPGSPLSPAGVHHQARHPPPSVVAASNNPSLPPQAAAATTTTTTTPPPHVPFPLETPESGPVYASPPPTLPPTAKELAPKTVTVSTSAATKLSEANEPSQVTMPPVATNEKSVETVASSSHGPQTASAASSVLMQKRSMDEAPPDPAPSDAVNPQGDLSEVDKQPKVGEVAAQTKDEVRTDIMEEDGLGYCIKDECDKVYGSPETLGESKSGYLTKVGVWLSKLIGLVRYVLPSPISYFDDAGVLVTLFVPICLLIHLVRVLIFADSSERDTFDRRTLHNALTAIRERDVQIKLLRVEAEKGKNAVNAEKDKKFESLQSEMGERLLEIQQLKTKCHMLEDENDNLKAETDETSQMIEKERLKCRELAEQNKKLEDKNKTLTKQLSEMRDTLEIAHEENERLDNEVKDKNKQLQRLESEANSHSLEMKKLKDQLETSLGESKNLRDTVEKLQNETVQLLKIIEMRGSGSDNTGDLSSVTHSGNSGQIRENGNGESGWSDFDEFDVDNSTVLEKPKKERSPAVRSTPADVMEVARLRAQLKNVEADLGQAKLTLQKQENEREHLMRKVELTESEAAKRMKEVETKEAERIEAHNQFKRILAMVEEREAKLRNTEELTEKLRSEVAKWQEEVRQLEDQKKTVELKLLETEQELKRLKAEYARLETRNFHEVRECKQTIAALQQSLEQVHLSNQSNMLDNTNLLNLSASSSDRDCGASLGSGLVAPSLPHVRPLWLGDEPAERFSSAGESSLLQNRGQLLNDRAPDNGNINYKRGTRSRRSIKDREHNSGAADGAQTRHKKEGRRMRSRSQGRHPLHTDCFPNLGMPAYPVPPADLYTSTMLSKQRSKSGTLYYSSGGSNDGRSPPPEIALLSGIPPPGPMIKKPTPRPKSSTEPVERRQS